MSTFRPAYRRATHAACGRGTGGCGPARFPSCGTSVFGRYQGPLPGDDPERGAHQPARRSKRGPHDRVDAACPRRTSVIEARAKATQVKIDASQLTDPEKLKQFQDAQNQLSGALGRLLAVSENYPDLKSNQNFLALQSQLEGTENRITVARRDYIEAVRVLQH
jgi:LemA family